MTAEYTNYQTDEEEIRWTATFTIEGGVESGGKTVRVGGPVTYGRDEIQTEDWNVLDGQVLTEEEKQAITESINGC